MARLSQPLDRGLGILHKGDIRKGLRKEGLRTGLSLGMTLIDTAEI